MTVSILIDEKWSGRVPCTGGKEGFSSATSGLLCLSGGLWGGQPGFLFGGVSRTIVSWVTDVKTRSNTKAR